MLFVLFSLACKREIFAHVKVDSVDDFCCSNFTCLLGYFGSVNDALYIEGGLYLSCTYCFIMVFCRLYLVEVANSHVVTVPYE
jgi:hypothetical protein